MAGIQGSKAGRPEGNGACAQACATFRPSGLRAFLPFCIASLLFSGCIGPQAKVTPDTPLDVPAPPPHDVEVTDSEPPAPVPLVQEPARNTPQRPRVNTPRVDAQRPEAPKTEAPPPAPAEPPKTEEPPKPLAPPTTTLQTTPAAAEGEVERGIRASLARATTDLNHVNYQQLSNDARTQYDAAKRFIGQADEALRTKNLVYARFLADKAAGIAAQLGGR